MIIGGSDLIFDVKHEVGACGVVAAAVVEVWPEALWEDAESDSAPLDVRSLAAADSREFFIYKNEGAYREWDSGSVGYDENPDMIHVLFGQDSLTVVIAPDAVVPERIAWEIAARLRRAYKDA